MRDRIAGEISRSGPIPFERFMEMALYDPEGGYFATGPLRSHEKGDFLTSPEVSSEFGAVLARYVEREYHRLGCPEGFTVLEAGAGSGSLLGALLGEASITPRAVAVEVSPAARKAIAARLPQVTVIPPDGLPGQFRGVVIANELMDNLPMSIAVREGDGWTERWVTLSGSDLALVRVPARREVLAWLDTHAGDTPEGGVVECQLEAAAWLRRMIERLAAGSILVIDYGDTSGGLARRRPEGTLRTYRSHHLGPHPLDEPGSTDITADVNFSALVDVARENGLDCELVRQRRFLADLGLADRLRDLRTRELELARRGDPVERLRVRSTVKEVETLLHPRGLGDFLVMVARR